MSASKGLQSLFSYSSDPVLPHLVSSWECLEISASLGISWTTLYCMVSVSSCRSLSLAHFLPRTLDSLLFLRWRILLVCCHFLLDVLRYVHWLCSLFYILHLSWAWYFILWLSRLILFSTRFSLQKGERRILTSTLFSRESPWSPYYFSLMELKLKVESMICGYRWSIDLVTVFFFHTSFILDYW